MRVIIKLRQALKRIKEKKLLSSITRRNFFTKTNDSGNDLIPLKEKERLRIVFLFQFASSWPSWRTVYEACLKDPDIDPIIVLVERTSKDTTLNFLNQSKNFLIENNLGFINDNAFSLEGFKPHIVFMQTPYGGTLPKHYDLERLQSLGTRIAYIPYGIEIGGGVANLQSQFNLSLQQNAWRVFARSKRNQRMYAKYCATGSAHVVPLGHPRTDLHINVEREQFPQNIVATIKNRRVFLWNPHFSVEKWGWSTFLENKDTIISFFKGNTDAFLIVRPHPMLFSYLKGSMQWSDRKIEDFKSEINDMDNAHLDLSADYLPSMHTADAILTDASSFLLEFFVLEKPIVYLNNPSGPGLNDDGEVLNHLYVSNNVDDLQKHLKMLHEGKDPMRKQRLEKIPEYFEFPEKGVGETIKDYMLATLRGQDRTINTTLRVNTAHKLAEEYWNAASTTYLAPEDYYKKQSEELQKLLNKIGKVSSAIDVGCGDGRFTKQICQHADFVKAIDVSPILVHKAKQILSDDNVEVKVESITESRSSHTYDLVSCMGVTSGLIDNTVFLMTLDILIAICQKNGYIVMKESLSTGIEQYALNSSGYNAVYRNLEDYKACFLSRNCTLVEEIELGNSKENSLTNKLFLFKVNK